MKASISISESKVGPVSVLRVAGSLDGHSSGDLERRVNALITSGIDRMVIELTDLIYIASAGVGFLISVQNRLKNAGGNLQLVNPRGNVREILVILGLEAVLKIHDTIPQAIADNGA